MTQSNQSPSPRGEQRAKIARDMRIRRAKAQRQNTLADTARLNGVLSLANQDQSYLTDQTTATSGLSTRFTKGLPHDELGNAHGDDYAQMRAAINTDPAGNPDLTAAFAFDVPLGPEEARNAHGKSANSKSVTTFLTNLNGQKGQKPEVRAWESPRAGHTYDTQGGDMDAFIMAPAPGVSGVNGNDQAGVNVDELAAEMAEVYALALLRDADFSQISSMNRANLGLGYSCHDVISALLKLPYFKGAGFGNEAAAMRRLEGRQNSGGKITSKEIFRGSGPDAKKGPFVSQLMLIGTGKDVAASAKGEIGYGTQLISQKNRSYNAGANFMTTWSWWLDVQNGANFKDFVSLAESANPPRFIGSPRDLSAYVHVDQLYQAYLNAALIMLGQKAEFDRGLPEPGRIGGVVTRDAFATFGGPHVLAALTEVSSRALKAVRRQKFNIHQRCRPEQLAAMITRFASGTHAGWSKQETAVYKEMHRQLAGSGILTWVNALNKDATKHWENAGQRWISAEMSESAIQDEKNYLLPMAFPEGSPMHPSYGAGHATVAGACVTILKAFFELYEGQDLAHGNPLPFFEAVKLAPKTKAFESGGNKLTASSENEEEITLIGELNKLAANISIGRNMAGVHFYSDYFDSVRMGERIAVQMLLDQMPTYGEAVTMRLSSFDDDRLTLSAVPTTTAGVFDAQLIVVDKDGRGISAQDWRLRHAR